MKLLKSTFCIALCLLLMGSAARADDAAKSQPAATAKGANHGTKDEAVAMVKKAIEYIKANGTDKAYAEIDNTDGKLFIDRELYVDVFSMEGKCLAHGANSRLIGQSLLDTEDSDGKSFVRERVELAGTHDSFWQDYKFDNPETHKIAPKESYCQRLNDTIVCAGVYKD